jgi:N4-gp56 family major capsid protein
MSAYTVFGDVGLVVGAQIVGKKLSRIEPQLVLTRFAKHMMMDPNKGEVAKARRVRPLAVSTTNLTEGVTPTVSQITYDTVTVVIGQFGSWVQITDKVHNLAEDPVLNDAADILADQQQATRELILWNEIRGGTQVVYANGAARTSVNTPLDSDLFAAATNTLKRNHAQMQTSIIKAGPGQATEPVGASFIGVGHVDFERDIRALSDFLPIERYSSVEGRVSEYEIGKVTNVRIILTADLPPWQDAGGTATGMRSTTGTNADVYALVIFGEEYFADLKVKGIKDVDMHVQAPGTKSISDPLGQRGFVSWKMWYAAKRLNELWGVRIEAAVTALT